ncbi:Uncharacterized protein ToN1_14530 [Aromatoleum petrolei]|nr:Uncharacterized protein ToN1_14530 [Aromatoleum petrolei]
MDKTRNSSESQWTLQSGVSRAVKPNLGTYGLRLTLGLLIFPLYLSGIVIYTLSTI